MYANGGGDADAVPHEPLIGLSPTFVSTGAMSVLYMLYKPGAIHEAEPVTISQTHSRIQIGAGVAPCSASESMDGRVLLRLSAILRNR